MKTIHKSAKLANVCYDIRGPVLDKARQMEEEGHKIIKLNIGNLAVFGFDAPEEIQQDMIRNLPSAAAYSDSKGIFAARKAVMQYSQEQGVDGVTLDDIYLGNGASELIVMATNALLNDGDEMLLHLILNHADEYFSAVKVATYIHFCYSDQGRDCWVLYLVTDHFRKNLAQKGINFL
jgi:alanine-synthesizing transaminase